MKKSWAFSELLRVFLKFSGILTYCFTTQQLEELDLFVINEEDNETSLVHCISEDDSYRKQEGFYVRMGNVIIPDGF